MDDKPSIKITPKTHYSFFDKDGEVNMELIEKGIYKYENYSLNYDSPHPLELMAIIANWVI